MPTRVRITVPERLSSRETSEMEALYRRYYTGAEPDAFRRDLFRKDFVILLLNGAISRYGAACGIPTPLNDALTRMILCIQSSYEKQYRDEPKSH